MKLSKLAFFKDFFIIKPNIEDRCVGSIPNTTKESGIGKPSSNSGLIFHIHFCTNDLGKGMNPLVLDIILI